MPPPTTVSRIELGRELARSIAMINRQIEEVKKTAKMMEIEPYEVRDAKGSWVMIPLLAGKAQALHALTLVNQKS